MRLKAMVPRANAHELQLMSEFCRARTKDYYRFDPLLHLRFDGDAAGNAEIRGQRLSPAEIAAVERADNERFGALRRGCDKLIGPDHEEAACDHLFHCGAATAAST